MSEDKPLEKRCIWHKSTSIPKKNPSYESCLTKCDGFNSKCIIYTPREDYFRNIAHYRKKKMEVENKELEEK